MEKLKLIIAVLAVLGLRVDGKYESTHHCISAQREFPCVAAEITTNAHAIQKTTPILLKLHLDINASAEYENLFGPTKDDSSKHRENFRCIDKFAHSMNNVTDEVFQQMESAIDMREKTEVDVERKPRALAVAAAIATAVASLLAIAGVAFWADTNFNRLTHEISSVYDQLEADAERSNVIASNVRFLTNHSNTMAIRSNLISSSTPHSPLPLE